MPPGTPQLGGFLQQVVRWLARGELSAAAVLELCLARIRRRESEVRAWVQVVPQPPTGSGPLDGIPFGAKDIFETRGMATEYGSPRYAGRLGEVEGAQTHRHRGQQFGERIGAKLAALVCRGLAVSRRDYQATLTTLETARRRLQDLWAVYPVLLSPAARGPAPLGLASTGDPALNAPWTGLHGPVITIPMRPGGGLPLGLQLAAAPGADAMLLATAVHLERELLGDEP